MGVEPELAKALLAVQKAMPPIEPDATNPHFKSKFVSLDHLLAVALPVLHKHDVVVSQLPSTGPNGEPALTTMLIHESGAALSSQITLILPKNDPQGVGSALTYYRRYSLAAALGISGEKDDDAQVATEAVQKPAHAPQSDEAGRNAPGTLSDVLGRLSAFCADGTPWIVEAAAKLYGFEDFTLSSEEWKALPARTRTELFGRLKQVVALSEDRLDFDPLAEPAKAQARLRESFSAAFDGLEISGPDPFDPPVQF